MIITDSSIHTDRERDHKKVNWDNCILSGSE